jgi:hypothetical protein
VRHSPARSMPPPTPRAPRPPFSRASPPEAIASRSARRTRPATWGSRPAPSGGTSHRTRRLPA